MHDFCREHNLTSDIEMIRMNQINEACERMLKSDLKYRFVIDMASLEQPSRKWPVGVRRTFNHRGRSL